ncbi:DsbA family protein [Aeromicrobium ginsengisoli]|uniref:Thioredoxin domain-containing protein n=1 Tax=Aeromicrobium ginsengisoli TaxID=363867 RepID=A0A5M4FJD2_9ACTN|nr:thioredoxin domain-containing protein [Aeromicrobium ginsengisoli]KAA1400082.1 thioredoxin domain-containing protein [Aeromicrobium ginsengisoli]
MASASDRRQRAERAEQMRKEREKADRKQRNLITIAITVVVVALIAVGAWAVSSAGGDDKPVGPLVKPAHTNSSYGFDYSAADAGGTAGADPVRVVLYEDFQCPVCKAFEEQNGAFLDDLVKKGEITIEYRMFAFLDAKSSTEYSTRSASAAMAVLDKGGVAAYKKFHDLLYANQPPEGGDGLPDATLIDLAKQAGVTGIDADVKDQTYAPWVRKALQAGKADGIDGTPTVVIDGKPVATTQADISAAIAAAK